MSFTPPESAGTMVPATAIIGWINGDGTANVTAYNLKGRSLSLVTPRTDVLLRDPGVIQEGDTMTVFVSVNESNPVLHITPTNFTYMNWAIGTRPRLSHHIQRGGPIAVIFAEGTNAQGLEPVDANPPNLTRVWIIHGILMVVAFVFLLPIGTLLAHATRDLGPFWTLAHMVFQVTGLIFFLASFIYILVANELPSNWLSLPGEQYKHGKVGIAICAFILLQPILGGLFSFCPRPVRGEPVPFLRRAHELGHHLLGTLILVLAVFNLYYGMFVMFVVNQLVVGNWRVWVGVCSAFLMLWCFLLAVFERWMSWRRHMSEQGEQGGQERAVKAVGSPVKTPESPPRPEHLEEANGMMVKYRV